MTIVRQVASHELTSREMASLRMLVDAAWADLDDAFTDEDFDHAIGGVHCVVEQNGVIVSHAAVVERVLHTDDHRLRTGYVEAVATLPTHRRRGHASVIMQQVGAYIDETFQLGALGTGWLDFYRRLGWVVWNGPTSVRTDGGPVPTPEDDGYVLVRLTPTTPPLDLTAPISCEWRLGDVW